MKRIISSSILLVAVLAVVIGGTGAFFTSQTASTGNVFTAGNISLLVNHTAASYNGEDCVITCQPVGDNLVVNGSFEEPVVTANSGNYQFFTSIPGWTREAGSFIELQRNAFPSADGVQHVELDGDGDEPATTIAQTITTIPGERYRLSFAHSPRPQGQAAGSGIRLEVEVVSPGSTVFSDVITTGTGPVSWSTYTYEFIAVDTTTVVRFAYDGTVNTFGGLLDDVRVVRLSCDEGVYQNTEGGFCELWEPTDLTTQRFFNFADVKPQDHGTNLISMVVESNESYLCLNVANKENLENDLTAPEVAAGDTTPDEGELGEFLMVAGWRSDSAGNKIGSPLFGPIAANDLGAIAFADSTTAPFGPIVPGETQYLHLEWCLGDLTIDGNDTLCDGAVPNINQTQTDAFLADLQFFAIQSRNNADFVCADAFPGTEEPPVTGQTVEVGVSDLNTNLSDFVANPLAWFFFNDTINEVMAIDAESPSGNNTITNSAPVPAGATGGAVYMRLPDGNGRYNIATNIFGGTALSSITSLNYRILDGTSTSETPYLHFNVSFDGVENWQNRLVMVPTAPGNAGVASNVWTTVDAIDGGDAVWCWSGMPPCGGSATEWPTQAPGFEFTDPTAPYQTWADIVAAYPGAVMNTGVYSFLGVRVGHPGPAGAEGFVDWVEMNGTTYNFTN